MNSWRQYCSHVQQTAPDVGWQKRLVQGLLGIDGEVSEIHHTSDKLEIGDVWWYTSLLYMALQDAPCESPDWSDVNLADTHVRAVKYIHRFRGIMADQAEKVIYQGADMADGTRFWTSHWGGLARHVLALSDIPVVNIWEANIEKLRDRHGVDFTTYEEQTRYE